MPEILEEREGEARSFIRNSSLSTSFSSKAPAVSKFSASDGEALQPRIKLLKRVEAGPKEMRINDLPGSVLTFIFTCISDTRSRNCAALVCRDWYYQERQTRSSLTLRGNLCNFLKLPQSFKAVTSLNLSYCSPWGYSLFQSTTDGEVIGEMLQEAFPGVKELTMYVRDAVDIQMVSWLWPEVEVVRLVRWHQRSTGPGGLDIGSEVESLFSCSKLRKLDLSEFYCWTEDIFPAVDAGPTVAANLRHLNLLKLSPEGFRAQQIMDITAVCRNLEEFFVLCEFNPKNLDPVGDGTLEWIATKCPHLRVLHLVDDKEWGVTRSDRPEQDVSDVEDANITSQGLELLAKRLPRLQSLALLLAQNVWDSRNGLEALFVHCRELTSLQLSHFHGVCSGVDSDGLGRGTNLTELSITSSVDLSDQVLGCIAAGCRKLRKLALTGCSMVSERGLDACVRALSRTLVEVEVSNCVQLATVETLRALEPIRSSIQKLQMDCVWDDEVVAQQEAAAAVGNRSSSAKETIDGNEEFIRAEMEKRGFSMNFWAPPSSSGSVPGGRQASGNASTSQGMQKKEKGVSANGGKGVKGLSSHFLISSKEASGSGSREVRNDPARGKAPDTNEGDRHGHEEEEDTPNQRCWKSLQKLSIWIGVGFLLSPLPDMGLGQCPSLTSMAIKVEGNCKNIQRPSRSGWGLASLSRYKQLQKLEMDLGDMVTFSISAPAGQTDLCIWERHYLNGIADLELREVNYKPPYDKDFNHRGLTLPAVANLAQCSNLRKIIVQGTAHDHFLTMLERNQSLREFQLRWEFYPAPEYETSTEIRVGACRRFEEILTERHVPD